MTNNRDQEPEITGKYVVYVDDNFHYMDKDERYKSGEYDSADEAIAKCKEIVDRYLTEYKPKFSTAEELYESYTGYGDDPFVVGPTKVDFSAWDYAKEQCEKLYKKH